MKNNQSPRRVRNEDSSRVPEASKVSSLASKEPIRNNKRHWGRLVGFSIFIIVVTLGIYAAVIIKNIAKISSAPFILAPLSADSSGRTNLLLLGEGDDGHDGEGLTDTMMLLSMNKPTDQRAQVSVPRDLRVYLSGYGYTKINSANARGGVTLAQRTVSDTLGVPISYYILTNFSGLVGVIDAVGGVQVDVKKRLYDPDYPCDNDQYKSCGMDIQPGLQHMDGPTALKYARCRKGTCGNDYGRAQRQQEIINLLAAKIITWQTLLNPSKLIPLTNALAGALKTNMGAVQMGEFGWNWIMAQKHNPITLVISTFPGNYLIGDPYSSDLLPKGGTFNAIQNRVQNIFTLPIQVSDIPSS
jgi:LCP family protein required for cell wall assembly